MSESRRWSTSKSALPCWLTFTKRFVFSSRSADVSISRFLSATLYFAEKEVQSVRGLLAGHLHGLDHVGRGGVDPGHDLVVAGGVGHIAGDGVVVGAELEVATDVSAVEPERGQDGRKPVHRQNSG